MPRPFHPSWLDYSNRTWGRVQVMKLLIMQLSPTYCHLNPLQRQIPLRLRNNNNNLTFTSVVIEASIEFCSCLYDTCESMSNQLPLWTPDIYEFSATSAPGHLQRVRGKANRGTTWRLEEFDNNRASCRNHHKHGCHSTVFFKLMVWTFSAILSVPQRPQCIIED
jgi:hypothetical protein